jgi:hypothetical protein
MSDYEEVPMGDEESTFVPGPGSPPNVADIGIALLSPLEGLVAGMHAMMQRFHGLLVLQSQVLDERTENKRATREMERALGRF